MKHKVTFRVLLLIGMVFLILISFLLYRNLNSLIALETNAYSYQQLIRVSNQSLLSLTELEARIANYHDNHDIRTIESLPAFLTTSKINLENLIPLMPKNSKPAELMQKIAKIEQEKLDLVNKIFAANGANDQTTAFQITASMDHNFFNYDVKILLLELKQYAINTLNVYYYNKPQWFNHLQMLIILGCALQVLIVAGLLFTFRQREV